MGDNEISEQMKEENMELPKGGQLKKPVKRKVTAMDGFFENLSEKSLSIPKTPGAKRIKIQSGGMYGTGDIEEDDDPINNIPSPTSILEKAFSYKPRKVSFKAYLKQVNKDSADQPKDFSPSPPPRVPAVGNSTFDRISAFQQLRSGNGTPSTTSGRIASDYQRSADNVLGVLDEDDPQDDVTYDFGLLDDDLCPSAIEAPASPKNEPSKRPIEIDDKSDDLAYQFGDDDWDSELSLPEEEVNCVGQTRIAVQPSGNDNREKQLPFRQEPKSYNSLKDDHGQRRTTGPQIGTKFGTKENNNQIPNKRSMYSCGYDTQKSNGFTGRQTQPNQSISNGRISDYRNPRGYSSNDGKEPATVKSGSVFKSLPMPPPETPSIRDFKSAREIANDSRQTRINAQKTLVPITPCLNESANKMPENTTRVGTFSSNRSEMGDSTARVGSFSNTNRGGNCLKEAGVKIVHTSDRRVANFENVANDGVGKAKNGIASYRPFSGDFEPYGFSNDDKEYSMEDSDISDSPFRSFAIPATKQTASDVVRYNADRRAALKSEYNPSTSRQQSVSFSKPPRPQFSHPVRMATSITMKEQSCPTSQVLNELSMNVCTTGSSFGAVNIDEKIGAQMSGVGDSGMRFRRNEENFGDRNEAFKSPEMQKQKIARSLTINWFVEESKCVEEEDNYEFCDI
eukprot:Seg1295.2 transcript_id=Seg1295.2/GoldUCD/mRNA.D3Y31 product="hypothetical protein" protein_id=Seg1295.2/GoldUCD/D3Y31